MTTLAVRVLEAIEAAERTAHEAGPAVIAWATYRHADGGMGYTSPVARNGDVWVVAGAETHPDSVLKVYDPSAVLRRCTADRVLLGIVGNTNLDAGAAVSTLARIVIRQLADGYGVPLEQEET